MNAAPPPIEIRKHQQSGFRVCEADDAAIGLALNLSTGHSVRQRTAGGIEEVRPRFGMINILPPTTAHTIDVTGASSVILVRLSWSAFRDTVGETSDVDPARLELLVRRHAQDAELTRLIVAATSRGPDAAASALPLLARRLVARHSNRSAGAGFQSGGLSPAKTRRVLEHIEREIAAPLLLHELAATVHLSPFHFAREFARVVGVPPHSYILQRRVHRALELLHDRPAAEAARAVGFVDASHFARQFRRQFGVALGEYRKGVLLAPVS